MQYNFSHIELINLIHEVSTHTVKQTLIELGKLKTTLTRAEVEKLHGRAMFEKSKKYVDWQKKGDSRNSTVICQKYDFENFLKNYQ